MTFSLRKTASLTALFAFTTLAATGIVLFLVPQGRVAFWSEWRLWGVTKEGWAALHILLSLLFLIAGIVHIVLNWGPILSYLKDRRLRVPTLTPDFLAAFALTALFTAGALGGFAPFRWVMALNTAVKDQASRSYGEPPYGHAEQSSLKTFCERTSLDLAKAEALLRGAGLEVLGPQDRLQDIAKRNGRTPQQVFLAMKAAEKPKPAQARGQLPEEVAPGLGRKTLHELCREHGLDPAAVRAVLEARKLKVAMDQPFRALAEDNGVGPHDLYATLRTALQAP